MKEHLNKLTHANSTIIYVYEFKTRVEMYIIQVNISFTFKVQSICATMSEITQIITKAV